MSNAKRRHRRRRRVWARWAKQAAIEAQWRAEGYTLVNTIGHIRVWMKLGEAYVVRTGGELKAPNVE